MANVLGYPLATLFNNCLRYEYIPRDWKLAKVVPVFKKGDRGNPENYRPISLLPTISKLYEKFLSYQMNNYLESNNVLSNRQHGFRRNRSTETAVLSLTEKITSSLERQNYTTAFFLDLSKAFDTVDHDILLRKLLHYGIVGKSYKILKDYLSYRRFFVCINDQTSSMKNINVGVPQGSVLGPLLFIIYMNDFHNSLGATECLKYADDTVVFCSGTHLNECKLTLSNELVTASRWFSTNMLKLNNAKSEFIIFGTNNKLRALSPDDKQINTQSTTFTARTNVNYLGVTLDNQLNYGEHINRLCTKVDQILGRLN